MSYVVVVRMIFTCSWNRSNCVASSASSLSLHFVTAPKPIRKSRPMLLQLPVCPSSAGVVRLQPRVLEPGLRRAGTVVPHASVAPAQHASDQRARTGNVKGQASMDHCVRGDRPLCTEGRPYLPLCYWGTDYDGPLCKGRQTMMGHCVMRDGLAWTTVYRGDRPLCIGDWPAWTIV